MTSISKHLERIMTRHNRISNLQVVFADIEKYSKRRTLTQTEVIDRFTTCLKKALMNTAKEYVGYAQGNDVNFQTDVIILPTGDGAATIFSFDGLHDIHLFFAKSLLKALHEVNQTTPCEKYSDQGWCNCHSNLGVRVGISEGKGVIYKDVNDRYNVAGSVINLAARVMNFVDRNQIAFTEEAFRQIIDMVDDPNLVDRFLEFKNLEVKHGLRLNVYQYLGEGEPFISSTPSTDMSISLRADEMMAKFKGFGMPMPDIPDDFERESALNMMENMVNMIEGFNSLMTSSQQPKNSKQVKDLNDKDDS